MDSFNRATRSVRMLFTLVLLAVAGATQAGTCSAGFCTFDLNHRIRAKNHIAGSTWNPHRGNLGWNVWWLAGSGRSLAASKRAGFALP